MFNDNRGFFREVKKFVRDMRFKRLAAFMPTDDKGVFGGSSYEQKIAEAVEVLEEAKGEFRVASSAKSYGESPFR